MRDPLARPIFVVAPPRAGAWLLASALDAISGSWAVTGGPGALLSGVPDLDPPDGRRAGRLVAADCEDGVRQHLRADLRMRFAARERAGRDAGTEPRLFDASPRNALMVPFLDAAFPDGTFVYIHRRPVDALAESLAVWRTGSATTYPALPGWSGPEWSFLLVPGWQELNGRPLAEVVTEQWVRTMRTLIADLEALSPPRWCVTDYDKLLENPAAELARLSGFLGLPSSAVAAAVLDNSERELAPAAAHAAHSELAPYLGRVEELADRAGDWIAARWR
jgi:hypothetical protein